MKTRPVGGELLDADG